MKRIILGLMMLPIMAHGQTLEECQQAAEKNYPLIRQYDLIEKTTDLTVANIQKGWLPQISASAQATFQSDVMSWPDQMKTMMNQMGIDVQGLRKDQYKIGVDVNQTIYDGGVIKNQKEVVRQQGNVQSAQHDVTMYSIRQRVNEMYFGLLLLNDQIQLNQDLQNLLVANEKKLAAMLKRGTASESDHNNVKAERLNIAQQMTTLLSNKRMLNMMLNAFCGMEIKEVIKPSLSVTIPDGNYNDRPELKLIEAQQKLIDAQEKTLDSYLSPKLSVFASGYYGYPGYNMFEDMLRHKWSLNGMIGAKLSWNIGALYTRKNDKEKLRMQRESNLIQRETFLFNNQLEQIQQNEKIEQYRQLMNEDAEIINLRTSVRKAAESKLSHGIIDVNDLIKEINNENAAKKQLSIHEIEMLKEIYNLKNTINH